MKTLPPSIPISKARVDSSLPVQVLAEKFLNVAAAKLSHQNQDFCGFTPINLVVKNSDACLAGDMHRP